MKTVGLLLSRMVCVGLLLMGGAALGQEPAAAMYKIVATAGINGAIEPSGAVAVISGRSQTFAITPNANYQIQDVYVDGASVGAVASYTFTNVQADHLIVAAFKIVEGSYTIAAAAGSNGTISPSGTVGVTAGASQAFAIAADANYEIADVLVDGKSVGAVASYEFTNVSSNHSIAVSFKLKAGYYSIAASAGLNGSISPSGTVEVAAGATQSFAIKAENGYSIADVLVDGVSVGAVASYEFPSVSATHVIYASFKLSSGMFVIVATPGVNGALTPSGTLEVATGSSKTFAIKADSGYAIADVWVDGASVGAVSTYTFSSISANHAIAAAFTSTSGPYTILSMAGLNGAVSPSGTLSVEKGASQTIAITPNSGYQVADVNVDGVSVGPVSTYTFSAVTSSHELYASFAGAGESFTILAAAGTGGTISPSGSVKVAKGGSQTFAITPSEGWSILAVLVDGASVGAASTYTFKDVQASHAIAATFAGGSATYTIHASAGAGGTITPSGDVATSAGCTYEFFFTPSSGYQIADVVVDGVSQGAVSTYTFRAISADHTIAASFNPVGGPYTIAASAGAGGSISPSGSVQVSSGGSQTFTMTPSAGYQVKDVLVDGASVGAVTNYSFAKVTANHSVAVSFTAQSAYKEITASAGVGGAISPSGVVLVENGKSQAFTVTAASGYAVADVKVDGLSIGAVPSYTFSNVTANHAIAAEFASASGPYTITATAGTGGTVSPSGAVEVAKSGSQEFVITASDGYKIANVYVDGVAKGAVASYTFSDVAGDHALAAEFVALDGPFTILASAGAGGAVSPAGSVSAGAGSSATFTITPDPGYTIADVIVDGVSTGPVSSYTFTNVEANHAIEAAFSAADGPYVITATASPGGTVDPYGHVEAAKGSSLTLTFIPDVGYAVSDVVVDGTPYGMMNSMAFPTIDGNHSVHVVFALMTPFTITKLDISTDSSKTNADRVSLGGAQLLFESFNPDKDLITIWIDGSQYAVGVWKTSGSESTPKYSFTSTSTAPLYKMTIDFKKKQWSFSTSKDDIWRTIDNSDGVLVELIYQKVVYGCSLAMKERTSWSFAGDKNSAPTPVAAPGEPMTTFTLGAKAKMSGKRDNSKEQADSFKITSGKGDINVLAFDPAAVSLALDSLAIAFGTFTQDKSGKPMYTFKSASDAKPKYSVKFDLRSDYLQWSFSMTSGDCSAIKGGETGVDVILAIGSYAGGLNAVPFQKARLSYKAE